MHQHKLTQNKNEPTQVDTNHYKLTRIGTILHKPRGNDTNRQELTLTNINQQDPTQTNTN